LTFLIVFLVVNLLGYPEITKKVVYVVTISTIIAGISNLFKDIYQAFERMEFMSIGQVLQSALSLVFAIIVIKLGLNVVYFAMIYLIVNLTVLSYHIVITTWKFLKPKIEIDLSFWRKVVGEAWPFAILIVFTSIYNWVDSVMLSYMVGDEAVGLYNAAYRIYLLSLVVPQIFAISLYPVMSNLYDLSKNLLVNAYHEYLRQMVILSVPLGIGMLVLSEKITLFIYGEEYIKSSAALQILIWASVFIYIGYPGGRLLEIMGDQKFLSKMAGIGAVLNFLLNLLFIPKWGVYGASFTTLLTESFFSLTIFFKVNKRGYFLPDNFWIELIKISFSSVTSIVLVSYLESLLKQGLIVTIISYGIFYFIFLKATKVKVFSDTHRNIF